MLIESTPHLRARREIANALQENYRCNIALAVHTHTLAEAKSMLAEYVTDVTTSSSDGNHVRHRPVLEVDETLTELGRPFPPPV